jgi:uncharacterized protein YbjT (DUF2867 family)
MTILLTGAGGFVGSAVAAELRRRDHRLHLLQHRRPPRIGPDDRVFQASLSDPASLAKAAEGCDAVVHLVGIIFEDTPTGRTFASVHTEGTRNIVAACRTAGVRRYVHMSALGTRPDAVSEYHRSKWAAEELVRQSGLTFTILRPSLIHGPAGDFTRMAAAWARGKAPPYLFMPYFGLGLLGLGPKRLVAPVFIDDIARAFADALDLPSTHHQTLDLSGPDALTWPEMLRIFANAFAGKSRPVLAIPAWYATLLTRIAPARWLPFNLSQVQMSREHNTADLAPFTAAYGWTPRPFAETLATYASS